MNVFASATFGQPLPPGGLIARRLKALLDAPDVKLRRKAFIQRGELRRLFRQRQAEGDTIVSPDIYLFVIAAALATGVRGYVYLGRNGRSTGPVSARHRCATRFASSASTAMTTSIFTPSSTRSNIGNAA